MQGVLKRAIQAVWVTKLLSNRQHLDVDGMARWSLNTNYFAAVGQYEDAKIKLMTAEQGDAQHRNMPKCCADY